MRWLRILIFLALAFACFANAEAKLSVVATIPDLGALAEAVGGPDVSVEVIAKGTQDPHYLEAKPSYMVRMSRADLLLANGLGLEVGWLPSLVRGARNPKINPGSKGYLELGPLAEPIEIPSGEVSRAMGDVHPEGNPHFTLDPIRMAKLAPALAARLGELDGAHRARYEERAQAYKAKLESKAKDIQARLDKVPVKKVVTYHKSLTYFLERYGWKAVAYLEPKPGIPPTAQHILDVINTIRKEGVTTILVDNFFDVKIAERIKKELPSVKIKNVGIAVGSEPNLKDLVDVQEGLARALLDAK